MGEDAFGASGYRYSGNILVQAGEQAFGDDGRVLAAVQALAAAVVEEFGLIGVNGVDFVVRDGVPLLIEINPRWTASMELVERVSGTSVFAAHARACTASSVSQAPVQTSSAAASAGKAVVYATSDVLVGDTRPWLANPTVRDVPRPGLRIAVGQPVCTVFATGAGVAACRDALVTRARGGVCRPANDVGRVYSPPGSGDRDPGRAASQAAVDAFALKRRGVLSISTTTRSAQ